VQVQPHVGLGPGRPARCGLAGGALIWASPVLGDFCGGTHGGMEKTKRSVVAKFRLEVCFIPRSVPLVVSSV
jgi:hypothetical protein